MRIEIIQETREENIQCWVKKIRKRIAREKADYESQAQVSSHS